MNKLENVFESVLFNTRFFVIIGVVGSLVSSLLMFLKGLQEIIIACNIFFHNLGGFLGRQAAGHAGADLTVLLIASIDNFLFGTVLLIFAMGLYELFISDIDPASRRQDSRPQWLNIHSLDDLKAAIGKVILMILVVRIFESATTMKYSKPVDLLYLGLMVLLVSAALFLTHYDHKGKKKAAQGTSEAEAGESH